MASGFLGIVFVALNWLLRGHAFDGPTLPALLIAALNFGIAVKLLQLRYWALILARILTLWLVAGFIVLVASRRFPVGPPVIRLATLVDLIIAGALAITIFMPSVSKAFRGPNKSENPYEGLAHVT